MEKLRTKLNQAADAQKEQGQRICFSLVSKVREEFEEILELISKSES